MSNNKYKQMMREVSIKIKDNDFEKYKKYKTICDRYMDNKVKLNIYGNCILCGKEFLTKRPYQKYCSKKCSDKYHKRKSDANRRKKGFYPIIYNIFPDDVEVDYHHIYPYLPFVVPLPRENHQEFNGNLKKHLDNANKWVNFYYGIDVVELLF